MRRFFFLLPLLVPVLVLATGCPNNNRQQIRPIDGDDDGGGSGTVAESTKELASDGWGTLEGQITYDGDLPENAKANITKDQSVCECDEARKRREDHQLVWLGKKTDAGWGVANVVIFLKAPQGKHFKIHPDYKDVTKDNDLGKRVLDQPFCAYEPRVVVLFPIYFDGKKLIESGQQFEVKNSAPISHNTKIKGNPQFNSDKDSGSIASGGKALIKLSPQNTPLNVSCDIHPWMQGFAWAFDHPYTARTDTDGKFKINNVPTGAQVNVVVWHEGIGFHKSDGFEAQRGKAITFANGKSETLNLKIKRN